MAATCDRNMEPALKKKKGVRRDGEEDTFSVVRKNATEDRKSMHDDTLQSLLVLKAKPVAFSDTCKNFTKEELAKLKSAHYSTVQAKKRQAAAVKKAAAQKAAGSDE